VPISLDACEACGAGFLAGATSTAAPRLPLVGDMGKMSSGGRLLVGVGIAVVLMILFVVFAAIGSHFI